MENQEYSALAASYYEYRRRLGYAESSCKALYHYLLEFLFWIERNGIVEISEVEKCDIENYESYLYQRPNKVLGTPLTEKSIYSHIRNISDFFEMLCKERKLDVNPCSGMEIGCPKETGNRTALSREEIKLLYSVAETFKEKAVLALAYGCGLRAGEMEACDVEDVKLRDGIVIVRKGKGGKRRVVPMSGGVVNELSDYYYKERYSNERAFMINERGRRMRDWTYNYILQALIDRTGSEALQSKKITIHNLRHSIATHLLESGVGIDQVRLFLGHHHLETTQIYTHISKKQLDELMNSNTD